MACKLIRSGSLPGGSGSKNFRCWLTLACALSSQYLLRRRIPGILAWWNPLGTTTIRPSFTDTFIRKCFALGFSRTLYFGKSLIRKRLSISNTVLPGDNHQVKACTLKGRCGCPGSVSSGWGHHNLLDSFGLGPLFDKPNDVSCILFSRFLKVNDLLFHHFSFASRQIGMVVYAQLFRTN